MKTLIRWLAALLLVVVVLAGALVVHVWHGKPIAIDWFYTPVFAKFALDRPELLSDMRLLPAWLDFHADDFDDASPAQDLKDSKDSREALDTLRRYERSALDREGRLSYDTLEYFLQIQVDGEKYRQHAFPVSQLNGVHSSLPNFMLRVHQVTHPGEAEDSVARLHGFARKFDQSAGELATARQQGHPSAALHGRKCHRADAGVHRESAGAEPVARRLRKQARPASPRQDRRRDTWSPKLGMQVKAVPQFSEDGEAGGYYTAGAFDGSRPGIFYVNLRRMSELPKFSMRTLAYHEGIPGHHFQISIAQELQALPLFRRVIPFTAYQEGWALYAERLAWELVFRAMRSTTWAACATTCCARCAWSSIPHPPQTLDPRTGNRVHEPTHRHGRHLRHL